MHRLGRNDRAEDGRWMRERDASSLEGELQFPKSSWESEGLVAHRVLNRFGRTIETIGSCRG